MPRKNKTLLYGVIGLWVCICLVALMLVAVFALNDQTPPIPTSTILPTGTPTPTNTPLPTATLAPTWTPVPAESPLANEVCPCAGDTLNCGDFSSHNLAQSCFDYCLAQGVGDVHQLDDNNDLVACENLP